MGPGKVLVEGMLRSTLRGPTALLFSTALVAVACGPTPFPDPVPPKLAPAASADASTALPKSSKAASPPRMLPLKASAMAADLRKLGLDPNHLPRFEALTPGQVRGIMPTFSAALGLDCADCHEGRMEAPTRMKHMASRMWNDFVKDYSADGAGIYCDSCHQGQKAFLKRTDHETVAQFMSTNFTEKLKRQDKKEVVCETCHGDPAEPLFLHTW